MVCPQDFNFLIDHVFGLPKIGWTCPGLVGTPRTSPPELPIESLLVNLQQHNNKIMAENAILKEQIKEAQVKLMN